MKKARTGSFYSWLHQRFHLQVFHGKRTMHNARDFDDLAKFLAEPVKEDVESHYVNLK